MLPCLTTEGAEEFSAASAPSFAASPAADIEKCPRPAFRTVHAAPDPVSVKNSIFRRRCCSAPGKSSKHWKPSPDWKKPPRSKGLSGNGCSASPPSLCFPHTMSLAIVRSRGLDGLSAPAVAVGVHIAVACPGHPGGLPDTEVKGFPGSGARGLLSSGLNFQPNASPSIWPHRCRIRALTCRLHWCSPPQPD